MKRLIAVLACRSYQYPINDEGAAHHSGINKTRSEAVYNTWYKHWEKFSGQIDLRFFVGRGTELVSLPNVIYLDAPDDYYSVTYKIQAMCQWALSNGYTDLLKIDDDCWLYVSKLLQAFEPTDYRGFEIESDLKYASGTAYWLSRRAMQLIADEEVDPNEWREDRWVGRVLARNDIKLVHDPRFQCCHCDRCAIAYPETERISSHTADPKRMYDLMEQTWIS